MGKSVINGITIDGNYSSISINNGKIYLDGKLYEPKKKKENLYSLDDDVYEPVGDYNFTGQLVINGNVGNVDATNVTINGDVRGDVDGTSVTVGGSVHGDVDGVSVTIKNQR